MAVNLGTVICFVFAAVWGAAGAARLENPWRAVAIAASIAISGVGIIWFSRPHDASHMMTFRSGIYSGAVAFEVVFIIAAVAVLRRLGRMDYILPAVGVIVGLHFLGMWLALDAPVFIWTAVGMCAASIGAILISGPSENGAMLRQAVAGFGCALTLWATGLFWWAVV